MKKLLIILMFGLLMLSGCEKRDFTQELCTSLKHSDDIIFPGEINHYMDGGVCIRETDNYSFYYDVWCESLVDRFHLIIKSQNEQSDEMIEGITNNPNCKVIRRQRE